MGGLFFLGEVFLGVVVLVLRLVGVVTGAGVVDLMAFIFKE